MGLDRMARNAVGIFCSTNTEKNRCLELLPYYYRDDNCQDIKIKDYQDEDEQQGGTLCTLNGSRCLNEHRPLQPPPPAIILSSLVLSRTPPMRGGSVNGQGIWGRFASSKAAA